MAIIENVQRGPQHHREAEGYRSLAEHFDLTQQGLPTAWAGSATIASAMRLLDLPRGPAAPSSGMLSTVCQCCSRCPTRRSRSSSRAAALPRTDRTRSSASTSAARLKSGDRHQKADIPESHQRYLLERLHARLDADPPPAYRHPPTASAKGCIEIDFYDNADLDRLLRIIGVEME